MNSLQIMMKKFSVMIVGVALAAVVSFVGAGGCDETQNAFNCSDLCNRYRDCFDHNYNTSACSSRCQDLANNSQNFDERANSCQNCMRATLCGSLVMLAAVVGTNAAHAAPAAGATVAVPAVTKVTVVDPPADDRILVEAGLRIRAELDAANLSNRALTCAGGIGSAACDATASAAAIALSRQDGLATIRVIATLPDGYELHRLIRVSGPAGGDDPAVLAVRAVELLRDIYLDVPRDFPHRDAAKPAAPPPPVIQVEAPVVSADRKALRMFLGAAVLGGRHGLGPAIAPVLGASLPIWGGLSLAGTASGPFSRLVGGEMTDSATTTQAVAMMVGGSRQIAANRPRSNRPMPGPAIAV